MSLTPFDKSPEGSERARQAQQKAVEARKKNTERKSLIIDVTRKLLNSRMKLSDKQKENFKKLGIEAEDTAAVGEMAIASIIVNSIATSNAANLEKIVKMAGMHYDQSEEAIGGAENPLNVESKVNISVDQVKNINDMLENIC